MAAELNHSRHETTTHEVNTAVQRLKEALNRGDAVELSISGVRQPDGRWLWKVAATRTYTRNGQVP